MDSAAIDEFSQLRHIPSIHSVLNDARVEQLVPGAGRDTVLVWVRSAVDAIRSEPVEGDRTPDPKSTLERVVAIVKSKARREEATRFGPAINATGVLLHTGLGRAPLSESAKSALAEAAGGCNLELDLESGDRTWRGFQILDAWRTLTGCEDALVVNNNAAATLLVLQGLCAGREVILSRGQLIEIGGSFRLPEIFALSGARLREVGTTNRTRLSDYESAIGPETAAILRVHPSNYRIVGFAETPGIAELAALARSRGILAIDDIGSGSLIDVTRYGLPEEPTFSQSIAAGADVVLGSGDKLLGGPQAGILLGRRELIERLRRHPLSRAVRIGKLTLAALAATLDAYRRAATDEIPIHRLLSATPLSLQARAVALQKHLRAIDGLRVDVRGDVACVGGGSVPESALPTSVVALEHTELSAVDLARRLRMGKPRVVPRISRNEVLLDLRSVLPEDDSLLELAVRAAVVRTINAE